MLEDPIRHPQQCDEADLQSAYKVIAVKEAEHRPLLIERYPMWPDKVEYWHIHDLDKSTPTEALEQIERQVNELIDRTSIITIVCAILYFALDGIARQATIRNRCLHRQKIQAGCWRKCWSGFFAGLMNGPRNELPPAQKPTADRSYTTFKTARYLA